MPLPSPTPSPILNPVDGTRANDVRMLRDQNQKIAQTLNEIRASIGNITNIRTNIQSGIYGAFGNNFLSRAMSQISDSLFDGIEKLFGFDQDQEEKETKTTMLLREQKKVLSEILDAVEKTANSAGIKGSDPRVLDMLNNQILLMMETKDISTDQKLLLENLKTAVDASTDGIKSLDFSNTLLLEEVKMAIENSTSKLDSIAFDPNNLLSDIKLAIENSTNKLDSIGINQTSLLDSIKNGIEMAAGKIDSVGANQINLLQALKTAVNLSMSSSHTDSIQQIDVLEKIKSAIDSNPLSQVQQSASTETENDRLAREWAKLIEESDALERQEASNISTLEDSNKLTNDLLNTLIQQNTNLTQMSQSTQTENRNEQQQYYSESTILLNKILSAMTRMGDLLSDFLRSQPISTQESDIESARRLELLDRNRISDTQAYPRGTLPQRQNVFSILDIFGEGIKKHGGKLILGLISAAGLFGILGDNLGKMIGQIAATLLGLSSLKDILAKLPEKLGGPRAPVPTPAPEPQQPKPSILSLLFKRGIGATALLAPSELAPGTLTPEQKAERDAYEKMTEAEREDYLKLMKEKRIRDSKPPIKKVTGTVIPMTSEEIERLQQDARDQERKRQEAIAPVMNNTTVNNNSIMKNETIMPSRPVIPNLDQSVNRYLDSIMLKSY